jgi:hypothetical protein
MSDRACTRSSSVRYCDVPSNVIGAMRAVVPAGDFTGGHAEAQTFPRPIR